MATNNPDAPDQKMDVAQNKGTPTAQTHDAASTVELLRALCEGDEQEQRETWEFLRQALDEDRLSDRKLFP